MANLKIKQVMALAGVSHMTVFGWRAGSKKRDPLPTKTGANPRSVEFQPGKLRAWARKYGIPLKHDPVDVATGAVKLRDRKPSVKTARPVKRVVKRTSRKA